MTVYTVHSTQCSIFHIEATRKDGVARHTAAKEAYHGSTGAHLTLRVASWQQEGARWWGEQA